MSNNDLIKQALEDVLASRKQPCKSFNLEPTEVSLFDSKVGGIPYLPHNKAWPIGSDDEPLMLLAQVNCAELSDLADFPHEGILQFFISSTDDCMGIGMNEDWSPNLCNQADFRVLYWEAIDSSVTQDEVEAKCPQTKMDPDYLNTPLEGVFRMDFAPTSMQGITMDDYRFDEAFTTYWNEKHPDMPIDNFHSVDELSDNEYALYDIMDELTYSEAANQVGGYPRFTQEDPRGYDENLQDLDVLLFQLDSTGTDDDQYVIWGDWGTGNFFINREALRARDFSRVAYTWDCC